MSDNDLIAWLRDLAAVLGKDAFTCAADRIEALEAKLAKAVEGLEAALKYNSAMHGGAAAYNKRIKDIIAEIKGDDHE